jgi:hypothetical protein
VTRAGSIQVINGTVFNVVTGEPVANVPVTLLNTGRDPVEDAVRTNEHGEFTIRTNRAGEFRLGVGSIGYRPTVTPIVAVSTDEMVIVRLFASPKEAILAPLAVSARLLPQTLGIGSMGGFTYRRERALVGMFFTAEEIARTNVASLGQLLRGVSGIRVAGSPPADTISVVRDEDLPRCSPLFYVDGARIAATDVQRVVGGLAMDRLFGVELYLKEAEVPPVFADAGAECGLILIWMKK